MTPDAPQLRVPILPPAERTGDVLFSISRSYRESRNELLKLLARASDILLQIGPKRGATPDLNYRVVFPPSVLEALKRGELHLLEAKDGIGFLPLVVDNRIVKQVRIVPERLNTVNQGELALAAGQAVTHALLREVLVVLHAVEQKIDEVLLQQQTEWRGRIAAGVQQLNSIEHDPGDPLMRAAVLANAFQSIEEGRQTGLLQLENYLRIRGEPARRWWQQLWAGGLLHLPSRQEADALDRAQEDLEWLYVAGVSSARIHQLSGRELEAREAIPRFVQATASILNGCKDRYGFARYSAERAHFWNVRVISLRALLDPPRSMSIGVEFEEQEIQHFQAES